MPSAEASLYCTLGAWFGREGWSLFRSIDMRGAWLLAAYVIVLASDVPLPSRSGEGYLQRQGAVLGLLSMLYLTGRISQARGRCS